MQFPRLLVSRGVKSGKAWELKQYVVKLFYAIPKVVSKYPRGFGYCNYLFIAHAKSNEILKIAVPIEELSYLARSM